MKNNKVLVILGPTASGKSGLAIKLSKKFNGEIISADSRQIYKGMDIGTGKITKKEMKGVRHHLLDITEPKKQFNVVNFKKLAEKKIEEILKKGKTPIICGGTGFYIDAVVNNTNFPPVKENKKLRGKLEKKSAEYLFKILKKIDSARAKNIDFKNQRRLIRAIEIAKESKITKSVDNKIKKTNKQLFSNSRELKSNEQKYEFLEIGIKTDNEKLKKLIHNRLISRIKIGMIDEIKKLHKNGVSWEKLDNFGLEYRYVSRYLRGLLNKEEMLKQLETKIWQYAKRQRTWFKKNKKIKWFELKNYKKIEKKVKMFMK